MSNVFDTSCCYCCLNVVMYTCPLYFSFGYLNLLGLKGCRNEVRGPSSTKKTVARLQDMKTYQNFHGIYIKKNVKCCDKNTNMRMSNAKST